MVFIDRDIEVEMSSIPVTEGWQGLGMEGCSRKLIAAGFLLVHKSINVKWKHPSVNALNVMTPPSQGTDQSGHLILVRSGYSWIRS